MSRAILDRCTCILRVKPSLPSPSSSSSTFIRSSSSAANPRFSPRSSRYDNDSETPRRNDSPRPRGDFRSGEGTGGRDSRRSENSRKVNSDSRFSDSNFAKRRLVDGPDELVLKPRIGEALKLYLALRPEGRRREDAHRRRMAFELTPEKLYAQEVERERISQINLNSSKHGEGDRERIEKSARAVGSKAKGSRPGNFANRYEKPQMVAGAVNQSTRRDKYVREEVKPVIRGGGGPGARQKKRQPPKVLKKVVLPTTMRLENLTNLLGVKLFRLQKAMERVGLENTNADRLLTAEDASLIALELNFDPTIDDEVAFDLYPLPTSSDPDLPLRPPVTGIFGHVDHGKTSLLDALRSTTVAAGEAGGITQHIGAFEVSVSAMAANLRARAEGKTPPPPPSKLVVGDTITFLDTPGHAAFTAMRERGAGVTDVVVLVVAADDGVKPQTEEVIGLIKSSDVGVVVAVTKVDKPGVDTMKVKKGLMAAGIEVEELGGDIPCVEVSSVTGKGLPELLETVNALAEFRELKAEREGRVEGRVLESRVEKGRGNVATVLVTRGCLRTAASLVAGNTWCKVRALVPPTGKSANAVYPGQPIEVIGWKDLPAAGDQVLEATSEEEAKKAVANRIKRVEQAKLWQDVEVINEKRKVDAELFAIRKEEEAKAKAKGLSGMAITAAGDLAVEGMDPNAGGGVKELLLIIKADVSGTVEAVVGALEGIGNREAKVRIISSAAGDINESDVEMARNIGATIVGFNVKATNSILKFAAQKPSVQVHTSPIIYRLVDIVRGATADLLPKDIEIRVHGEANVQQLFEISVKGSKVPKKIAGCKVGNGVFQKARKARVVRNGETLHIGTVSTLKQVKKDVNEITKGVECGIALDDFDTFEVDDLIQSIEEIEVARSL
ncbi:hypothetical protein MNV49_000245 [Pseudohyphozyma bogoriensis]|nr:hypothetical protein MNV49_000245 [Pseudohyphozyma bogoriensis]